MADTGDLKMMAKQTQAPYQLDPEQVRMTLSHCGHRY